MSLNPGTRLGPYEIVSSIGAGGMGEVYRALDTRLSREVAIKVLPQAFSADAERLRRFEQEARAAGSLNHPNILVIYDVGTANESPYVVAELLEGETLRDRIGNGGLSLRKALDYALQVVHGLAAAHDKGIVHRDLKPENIFITKDGRAKILDFGLAKLTTPRIASVSGTEAPTIASMHTAEGMVVGTVHYMSPEQVRGRAVDSRSDIFSFGSILLEMLTGQRAFSGESGVEIMNAILKEDPLESAAYSRFLDPAVERVVRHCLEKDPEERFQSARDLAFALSTLSASSSSTTRISLSETKQVRKTRQRALTLGATLLVAAVALGSFLMGQRLGTTPQPSYRQLTFNRGRIHSARFAPGGDTLVYTAAWSGNPIDIFTMRGTSPESRSLGLEDSLLLSISSSGELAILLRTKYLYQFISRGTLARMPLGGGAPREILEDVQLADWSPDGSGLAVVRWVSGGNSLEYPVGTVLYQTAGYLSNLRFSPDGKMIAFFDHQFSGDNRGTVAVVDLSGYKTTLTGEFASAEGLAWSPTGNEVWFTASKAGESTALYAVTLSGTQRLIATAPAHLLLRDISREGRVLLTTDNDTSPIISRAPGEIKERDLTWLNFVRVNDVSSDGKTLIFVHSGEGSGPNYTAYLRKTDGSPAVRLGEGDARALSPDGKQVLTIMYAPPQIVLLPTGPGQPQRLERYGIEQYDGSGAGWLPDGRHVVFWAREPGHNVRSYIQDIHQGPPRPITPEGLVGRSLSPDGRFVIAEDTHQNKFLCPVEGGEPRQIPGVTPEDFIARWTSDPSAVYVYRRGEIPVRVYRLLLATGHKELFRELIPSDPAGIVAPVRALLTPDGKGYVYAFGRQLSDLYVVDGLR
jgi:serine/threonine protein kinase